MRSIPDETVDLVWFSPPYWDLHKYSASEKEIGHKQSLEDYINYLVQVGAESNRVLAKTGNLVINIMDVVRSNLPVMLSDYLIKDIPMIFVERIVWYIRNKMPVSSKRRFSNKFEWILHFAKTQDYYFDKDSVREPHSHYAAKDKRKWKWNKNGKCPGNIWNIKAYRVSGKRKFHQAAFPIELCDRVIKAWSPQSGLVLDPFAGSGTTLVSAKNLQRCYLGIELSPEYVAIAEHRLETE